MSIASKMRQLGRVMTDVRWWPFYLQRQVMAPSPRTRLSGLVAAKLRPQGARSPVVGSDTVQRIADMEDAGISHFGQLLSTNQAAELRQYFLQKPVKDPYRADGSTFLPDSPERHPDSHITHHEPQDIVLAPYLFSIANRTDILAIVEGMLGCKPTLGYLATWWSYHTDKGAQQAEHFHRDVDDWRFVKLFIYLTDVGAKNGPHIYVSHSSASPELRQIRRFTDEEVVATFGADQVMELTGRAGEGFLEDTFGIHKGQPVTEGCRLIFQAVYSMYPLPYGPKSPVIPAKDVLLADGSRPDPWINRLYLANE
jgi:hypothetical protein